MIDFRYHLVSLVSVFLALAVGIVLGSSTPVKEAISSTVTNQVTQEVEQLRADKSQLRSELATEQNAVNNRDQFATAVMPVLVSGQLGGRSVVVITLPGAGDSVKDLTQALTTSGATVTGHVDVKDSWTDPGRQTQREQLLSQLRASLATTSRSTGVATSPSAATSTSADTGTDAALAAMLTRAVVTADLTGSGQSDTEASALLSGLKSADLISVDGKLTGRATEAVIVAPPVEQATATGAKTPATTPAVDTTPVWTGLAQALDAGSDGTVVVGPASSATQGGVVSAVRSEGTLARLVSTVDSGGTPMGYITTVLALREQLSGSAGNYGFGSGAQAPMPELSTGPRS